MKHQGWCRHGTRTETDRAKEKWKRRDTDQGLLVSKSFPFRRICSHWHTVTDPKINLPAHRLSQQYQYCCGRTARTRLHTNTHIHTYTERHGFTPHTQTQIVPAGVTPAVLQAICKMNSDLMRQTKYQVNNILTELVVAQYLKSCRSSRSWKGRSSAFLWRGILVIQPWVKMLLIHPTVLRDLLFFFKWDAVFKTCH